MSYTSITDNWKNTNSFKSVKYFIHEKIKRADSINPRPKRVFCHECNYNTKSK